MQRLHQPLTHWLLPVLVALLPAALPASEAPIPWQTRWSQALFEQAAREHRFVILDLHAVWCHWCHVMDEETYANAQVRRLIASRYVPVSVDADSDPALMSRYGDWGWPATIVLAADGTEIVKRRGFIPPEQMTALLQAIIDDPRPGPSVEAAAAPRAVHGSALEPSQRAALVKVYDALYDSAHGGWGEVHKYLDAPTMEYTLALLDDEGAAPTALSRARQTLDANLALIDPVWGGVYQYSDAVDWSSPHYEKLLAFQADDLRLYSLAWARWHDPHYLEAAHALHRYLVDFLLSPEGAFYVSQDADLSGKVTGHEFYAAGDEARRALGVPRVDTHRYARENGWVITALCRFHDVTGEAAPLAEARRAARWVQTHRALPGGGFRHGENDDGGPFLNDTLAMGQAFLALYRSSGERQWLTASRDA
ncbi:MAG: thioredoxin domain-containing protein, partial [Gammaproteobacteria bacterium]|nr:thioredoxin domain-containing protein [Gammaproteobacteria bacterium]